MGVLVVHKGSKFAERLHRQRKAALIAGFAALSLGRLLEWKRLQGKTDAKSKRALKQLNGVWTAAKALHKAAVKIVDPLTRNAVAKTKSWPGKKKAAKK